MRIVLDTNVLISGIFFGGIPGHLVDAWLDQRFIVYMTPLIYEEYLEVIDQIRLRIKPLIDRDWPVLLPELCPMVPDEKTSEKFSRDPSDDKFIFCAINSKAHYLVTGDLDLKVLTQSFGFKIVSPSQFVNILE